MKKTMTSFLIAICSVVFLCACGQTSSAPTWQEQYDLGVRYLSEGNYEEAIIAFTAAIEIDPKQEEAYVGLANVYTAQGDIDKAVEVLQQAITAVGETETLTAALKKITPASESQSSIEEFNSMLEEENAISYGDLPEIFFMEYDQLGSFFDMRIEPSSDGNKSGYYHGIEYSIPTRNCRYKYGDIDYLSFGISSKAPDDGEQILSVDINATDCPDDLLNKISNFGVGLRDISMGDDYVTVLDKLGLDGEAFEDYKGIWIDLYPDGARSYVAEESGVTYGEEQTPQINVSFYNDSNNRNGKSVTFEFHGGNRLNRVLYDNNDLLISLIQ